MKRIIFPLIIVAVIVATIAFQYNINYEIRTAPPSAEWSKDVIISSGKVKNYPKILELNGKYWITHDDFNKVKLIQVDKNGNKLQEKFFQAQDEYIRGLNLLTDGKYLYLNWVTRKSGVSTISNIKLDEGMNQLENWKIDNVIDSIQLDEFTQAISFKDKVEIKDIRNGKTIYRDVVSPTFLSGYVYKDKYIISYWENEKRFMYFTVENGIASDIQLAYSLVINQQRQTIRKTAVAMDDKYGYIVLELRSRDAGFGIGQLISFSLDGKEKKFVSDLGGTIGSGFMYNPVSLKSVDGARFLVGAERVIGRKDLLKNIMDFTIRDDKIVERTFVSKTNDPSMYPGGYGDMAVFCSYTDTDEYNIHLSSQNPQFIAAHLPPTPYEKKLALWDTIEGIMSSLIQMFFLSMRWALFGLMLMAVLVLLLPKHQSTKFKFAGFIIVSLVTAVIKILSIHETFYVLNSSNLPDVLSSTTFGMAFCTFTSLISYIYAFIKYRQSVLYGDDKMPIFDYSRGMVLDSLMTLIMFVPFL